MKFWHVARYFILILLLSLPLSVVLTKLITPSASESIGDIIITAREEGWLHGRNRASAIWSEYQARKHAIRHIEPQDITRFLIVLSVLFPTCWWLVK